MRRPLRTALIGLVALTCAVTAAIPAAAITGGTEDTANTYDNVGLIAFYEAGGRYRCTATLRDPRRAAHRRALRRGHPGQDSS